jgi:gamma-glutamylcyclotransferase (GGCT)/AIG2-like uncharacterized protein YtfP
MYIFVYGTLKKRGPNHQLLNGSEYICTTRTIEKYTMLDLGLFPGVLKDEGSSQSPISFIHGEVYYITPQTLNVLDNYEGEWYFREEVELEAGTTAMMYFLRKIPPIDYEIIPEGNWENKAMLL